MQTRHLILNLALLTLALSIVGYLATFAHGTPRSTAPLESLVSASNAALDATSSAASLASPAASSSTAKTSSGKASATAEKPIDKATDSDSATSTPQASRISDPYPMPPLPFESVNALSRAALVNIFCFSRGSTLRPISGSGVIIDPRGIVLTNAHVAQYVLLSEVNQVHLDCYVRSGSPAAGNWLPEVMYIPSTWVQRHASELTEPHPVGTGEHDYALLSIMGTDDGSPLPASFPYISVDTREAIGFEGDRVIAAGYPAEFLGSSITFSLYPASTITNIEQLLTFGTSSVDAISVGGVIEAQSGSSGGGIVNAWGRLIGIITTTSVGATTADRDLRGITLSYIDRDLTQQTGTGLAGHIAKDPRAATAEFTRTQALRLATLLVDQITQ